MTHLETGSSPAHEFEAGAPMITDVRPCGRDAASRPADTPAQPVRTPPVQDLAQRVVRHAKSPGLDPKSLALVGLAALVARQAGPAYLTDHVRNARAWGYSQDEIFGAIIEAAQYAGFFAARDGQAAALGVFAAEDKLLAAFGC